MSIAKSLLRERVCRKKNSWVEVTTTSAGATDFSTLVSTELGDYKDGALKGKYAKVTSGDTLLTRKIENNFSPLGMVKLWRVFTAQIASGVTVEIHDTDPDLIDDAINEAIRQSYPQLCKFVKDRTLIAGNILINADFEDWAVSTYPDYWRTSVSTLTQDTTYVLSGDSSLKVVNAGYAYLSSDNHIMLLRREDTDSNKFECWALCSTADAARLQIYTKTQDGTEATTSGDYHTGGGEWELLEVDDVSIPDDLGEVQIRCAVTGANTAYFDKGFMAGTVYEYLVPSKLDVVLQAFLCNNWKEYHTDSWAKMYWTQYDNKLRMDDYTSGKKIELVGYGEFDALSTEAATLDCPTVWENIIATGALAIWYENFAMTLSSKDAKEVERRANKQRVDFERLKALNPIAIASYQSSRSI